MSDNKLCSKQAKKTMAQASEDVNTIGNQGLMRRTIFFSLDYFET
jgi:hypothetical protein